MFQNQIMKRFSNARTIIHLHCLIKLNYKSALIFSQPQLCMNIVMVVQLCLD